MVGDKYKISHTTLVEMKEFSLLFFRCCYTVLYYRRQFERDFLLAQNTEYREFLPHCNSVAFVHMALELSNTAFSGCTPALVLLFI